MKRRYQSTSDKSVPICGQAKKARMDLGIAVARFHALPNVPMNIGAIAAFCGCTYKNIQGIERRALAKARAIYELQMA